MTTDYSRITRGDAPPIVARRAVVLHDDEGNVRHLHSVTTLEGAHSRSLDEHEQDAHNIAQGFGHDVSKLRALHVDPLTIGHAHVRVDVERGELVERKEPLPGRRA